MMKEYYFLGNGEEWCQKSASELSMQNGVMFYNGFPTNRYFVKKMIEKALSDRIPTFLKKIYMPLIHKIALKNIKFSNDSTKFLCLYDWNPLGGDEVFLNKIKKIYKDISLIYIFTNICQITRANQVGYIKNLNSWYDVVFAFDPKDAIQYDFNYSPLIYDVGDTQDVISNDKKHNSVFYVGKSKDRLSMLLDCFDKLNKLGINSKFYITNVKESDMKYTNSIVYNKYISYNECLNLIKTSSCILDVIQGDSHGLTIKTCEAICFNKKLITTNQNIKDYPFYDSRYIKVIKTVDDIDLSFFENNNNVAYSQDAKEYFSSQSFLKRIDEALENKKMEKYDA